MDSQKIGKFIAKKRKEKGLTQQSLANQLGVTNKAISKWETGTGIPDVSLLKSLSVALDITVDELLSGEELQYEVKQKREYQTLTIHNKEYILYLYEWIYAHRYLFQIFMIIGSLMITGGYALFNAQRYPSYSCQWISSLFVFVGFIMILCIPIFILVKKLLFKDMNVSYLCQEDGFFYRYKGEDIFYRYEDIKQGVQLDHQSILYVGNKRLWIRNEDCQEFKNMKATSYQKKVAFIQLILMIIFCQCLCLELGYVVVLKKFGFEYIFTIMEQMILECMMFSLIGLIIFKMFHIRKKQGLFMMIIVVGMLLCTTIFRMQMMKEKTIFSISPHLSSRLVLKQSLIDGTVSDYHYSFLCFAKETNRFESQLGSDFDVRWLTSDCCMVTYQVHGHQDVYVATYGDRGNGISYYNVVGSLSGKWEKYHDNDLDYSMNVENGEISIIHDGITEVFSQYEIILNGTISATLYKDNIPCYVIAMNEDCTLNQDYLVKNSGHIQLVPLKGQQPSIEMFCTTYKEDEEVQQQIDDECQQKAITLIQRMQQMIKNDPTLRNYESTDSLFKIEASSVNYNDVVKKAFQQDINYGNHIYQQEYQITQIHIPAGTIQDFYAEVNSNMILHLDNGETSENEYIPNYRIMKADGAYLIAKMEYRVFGDEGLAPLASPLEMDCSSFSAYHFVVDVNKD